MQKKRERNTGISSSTKNRWNKMEACVNNSDSILISFLAPRFISLHAIHYFIFCFAFTASRLCASDGAVNYEGERKTFRRVIWQAQLFYGRRKIVSCNLIMEFGAFSVRQTDFNYGSVRCQQVTYSPARFGTLTGNTWKSTARLGGHWTSWGQPRTPYCIFSVLGRRPRGTRLCPYFSYRWVRLTYVIA